mmetsp:Transcript_12813/g.32337  ORF Transcript_12813/g.32337 Transcript_12813/m.32337 type:complete len:139 (+) Transcript_12813:643-1059(+)
MELAGRTCAGRKDIEPPSIARCGARDDTDDKSDVHGDEAGVISLPAAVATHAGGEILTGDMDCAIILELTTTGGGAGDMLTDDGGLRDEQEDSFAAAHLANDVPDVCRDNVGMSWTDMLTESHIDAPNANEEWDSGTG